MGLIAWHCRGGTRSGRLNFNYSGRGQKGDRRVSAERCQTGNRSFFSPLLSRLAFIPDYWTSLVANPKPRDLSGTASGIREFCHRLHSPIGAYSGAVGPRTPGFAALPHSRRGPSQSYWANGASLVGARSPENLPRPHCSGESGGAADVSNFIGCYR